MSLGERGSWHGLRPVVKGALGIVAQILVRHLLLSINTVASRQDDLLSIKSRISPIVLSLHHISHHPFTSSSYLLGSVYPISDSSLLAFTCTFTLLAFQIPQDAFVNYLYDYSVYGHVCRLCIASPRGSFHGDSGKPVRLTPSACCLFYNLPGALTIVPHANVI